MKKYFLLFLMLFSFISYLFPQNLQSPEQFLGYKVGDDYKLADYETIQKYFKLLSENSNKIIYREIGKTSEGRNMFMAIISSEDNITNLDKYKQIVGRLSDPRGINDEEAEQLAKEGKIVTMVTCNIHSTEIASSQMAMELAYDLIVGKSPDKVNKALNNVIFIIMPSINPDGTTMVVNWYNKYLNTKYEGSWLPFLYHKYAGHDNNRDWFMFNLPETRNVIDVAFKQWHPQIWLDEHQMDMDGARLFVVPYMDPINQNVNTKIRRWQKVIGGLTALYLEERNLTGVIDQAYFDDWWEGAASDCGLWHNQISLLSEMASCNIASPVYIDPSEVKATDELTTYDIRTNYPSPWRGGWWRLRDIVNYEKALTYSLMETSADYKDELLYNYYLMGKEAVEKGKTGNPFAYIVPCKQNDPVTTSKMIDILMKGGVEVNFTDKAFTIGSITYPAESYVIYLAQPNGRYVKDLFEEQDYPDLRKSRDEKPHSPYDITGWTLPYMMGVKFFTINDPFDITAKLIANPNYPLGSVSDEKGKYFIAQAGLNVNSTLINRMQKNNIPVFWNTVQITDSAETYRPGSVLIPLTEQTQKLLKDVSAYLHIKINTLKDVDPLKIKEIKKVKLGLYKSYTASMDEGWTRLLLENYEFEYISLTNKDMKDKKLKDKVDVIIIPDMNADLIKTGKYTGEDSIYNRPKPPEYEGGIEKEGVENLKNFVEKDGGYIITLGEACNFAIEDLGLRVSNILKKAKRNDFYCPGSLIKIKVDNSNPIGYGMEEEAVGYLNTNLAFATSIPFGQYDRSIIVRYPTKNLLKSGFLIGEDYLFNRAAVVNVKQNKGHVILFGINVQNRHQTFGTFKLLFNAIHSVEID